MPILKADDAVGIVLGKLRVVRDHNDQTFRGELLNQVHNLDAGGGVQCARAQQDLRVVGQGAGNGDALHLAAGELVGALVQVVLQADLFQNLQSPAVLFLLGHAGERHAQLDIGDDAEVADEVVALKHKADGVVAVGVPVAVLKVAGVLALNQQVAAVIAVQSADDVEEGGFTGAARPQYRDKFLFAKGDAYII